MNAVKVPFFRPDLTEDNLQAVVGTLRSGWLTTGPQVGRFEAEFAESVGARYAVAVNSCTAALHLGVEALGLRAGELVLVPTMTFAATAEVVRYLGAVPLLVHCDPETLNLDLGDAGRKIEDLRAGRLPASLPRDGRPVSLRDGVFRMAEWARRVGARKAQEFQQIEIRRNLPTGWSG